MVKLRARLLLLGDAAVGKSSLSHMFHSDSTHFQKIYSMTTGVDLKVRCVNIPDTGDSVELFIIDTAGKETLVEACEKMWGEVSVLCLVFDLTSEQSFSSCGHWMERVREHCQGRTVPGVLVGNKCDLSSRREVLSSAAEHCVLVGNKCDLSSRREVLSSAAEHFAQSHGLEYHETAANGTDSCDAPLLSLARSFLSVYQDQREAFQNMSAG